MHAVTAVETWPATDCTKVTKAEAMWMGLVQKMLLTMCDDSTADLPTVHWDARNAKPTIAASLGDLHAKHGKPLQPVWRPDASVPRWVCRCHMHEATQD